MSDPKEVSIFDGLERKKAVRATAGQRLANCLIDSFLFYFIFMILSFIASIIGHSSPSSDNLLSLYLQYNSGYVTIAINIAAYTMFEGTTGGKTIGKMVTNTVAVTQQGERIGLKEAFFRSILRWIPVDFLFMVTGRPLHDIFTNTLVVKSDS